MLTDRSDATALAEPIASTGTLRRVAELHAKWRQKLPEGVRASVSGETFSGVSFPQLELPLANLSSSTWIDSDLSQALLSGCQMDSSDCRQAVFNRADLTGVTAEEAQWSDAWFLDAILAEVKLSGCIMKSIHAAGSRWQDSQLNRCDFTGAGLSNTAFHQAKIYETVFSQAQLDSTQMMHARIQLSRMVGLQGMNANFGHAALLDCDLSQAFLAKAKFNRADLSRSRFYKANLSESDLRDAKLNGCDLSRASLEGARMGNAQLRAADLRGANLRGAKELTADQLGQAFTDNTTTLPNGSAGPFMKRSGAERPAR